MKLPILKFLFLVLVFSSCSSKHIKTNKDAFKDGHFQLYSHPELEQDDIDENLKRIVIVGTNDLHGEILASRETTVKNRLGQFSYSVGGAAYLSSYFKILRAKYPNQTIFLDAGDIYQGSRLSNFYKGLPTQQVLNELGYTAATIGRNEFNFGPRKVKRIVSKDSDEAQGALKDLIKGANFNFVASNVLDLKTGKPIQWENTVPYVIKEINSLKVGILAITSKETPFKTFPQNVRGLYFQDGTKAIVKYARELRNKGANIVILLSHSGLECGIEMKERGLPPERVNFEPRGQTKCNKESELVDALEKLPSNLVDAVVTGGNHTKLNNFIEGIPTIQSFSHGKYFGRMELYFDVEKQEVDQSKTVIYQPTKVCHQFFESSEDCYGQDKSMDYSKSIPATFLGEEIKPHQHIQEIISPYERELNSRMRR